MESDTQKNKINKDWFARGLFIGNLVLWLIALLPIFAARPGGSPCTGALALVPALFAGVVGAVLGLAGIIGVVSRIKENKKFFLLLLFSLACFVPGPAGVIILLKI